MFKAIRRFFRAIGHMMTGKIDAGTKGLNEDPHVVRARFDELIETKRKSILQVRNAVAGLIRNVERKRAELKNTNEELGKKERLMSGAKAMATKIAAGQSREAAQQDPEFVKCMKAYQDFTSSLELLAQRKEMAPDSQRGRHAGHGSHPQDDRAVPDGLEATRTRRGDDFENFVLLDGRAHEPGWRPEIGACDRAQPTGNNCR